MISEDGEINPFDTIAENILSDSIASIQLAPDGIVTDIYPAKGNDYIHFHLRKADGSYLSVLDHGRIVESQQYGRVFYVLFMDWEDMHIHYEDKFSE